MTIQRYSPFIDEMGGEGLTPAASMGKHADGAWVKYADHVRALHAMQAALSEAQLALSQMVSREVQRESSKNFLRGVAAPEVYRG